MSRARMGATMTAAFVAIVAIVEPATAAVLTKDGSEVVVRGTFDWTKGDPDDLDVTRPQTDYEFRLPFAGSPFDPNFTPPPESFPESSNFVNTSGAWVDAPNTNDIRDSGQFSNIGDPGFMQVFDARGIEVEYFDRDNRIFDPQPNISQEHVRVGWLDTTIQLPDGLTGDRRYEFYINFEDEYRTVTSIAAIMTNRIPIRTINPSDPDQEIFVLAGVGFTGSDVLEVPVDVATVPIPAAAPLLLSGLAFMGYMRYRRAQRRDS
ncbi:MAG: VPLPA-CTERM sorting domain-containing protein [Pseudomonadota bacterium]